jgi:hypothetical protein
MREDVEDAHDKYPNFFSRFSWPTSSPVSATNGISASKSARGPAKNGWCAVAEMRAANISKSVHEDRGTGYSDDGPLTLTMRE